MEKELIVVKQLPIIEEQLRNFKEQIQAEVDTATALACTEDTIKSVKEARARLRTTFAALEARRIEIKKQILAPYEQLDAVYKECVTTPFTVGDAKLKASIDDTESGLKKQKENEVREYYDEYVQSKLIDFLTFERVGLNVTLTATSKKLKEQVKEFVDKVFDEIALIDTQADSAEILVEYRQTLDVAKAILTVSNRRKAIEEERIRAEQKQAAEQAKVERECLVETVIEEFHAPTVEPAQPEVFKVTFTVNGTREQITALKKYMTEEGIIYV